MIRIHKICQYQNIFGIIIIMVLQRQQNIIKIIQIVIHFFP